MVSITIGRKRRKKSKHWKVWKLNNQLLKDENVVAAVTDLFEQISRTTEHVSGKWELFKQELKQIAIERASVLKFQKSGTEKTLISNLRVLVQLECQNSGQGLEDIIRIKAELDKFHQERYQGAVIRSRAVKYFLGEQPTKKVVGEEKRYAMTKEIQEIRQNNMIMRDSEAIAEVFSEHYT